MSSDQTQNHRKKTTNLPKKVDDLAHKYLNLTQPSPILREIIRVPEQYSLLVDAVARQAALIKCRSPNFEDGQVSIYDQALIWLTGMGANPTHLGALEFYLTEFLGVVPICAISEGRGVVERHTRLRGIIMGRASESHQTTGHHVASGGQSHRRKRRSSSCSSSSSCCPRKNRHDRREKRTVDKHDTPPAKSSASKNTSDSITSERRRSHRRKRSASSSSSYSSPRKSRHYGHDHGHERNRDRDREEKRPRIKSSLSTTSSNNDSHLQGKVERILAVYTRAKEDYDNADRSESATKDNKFSAARFLRDTAENALNYLRTNGLSDHASIPELEQVFELARDKATELSGGRKRRFETSADNDEKLDTHRGGKRNRRILDSYRP